MIVLCIRGINEELKQQILSEFDSSDRVLFRELDLGRRESIDQFCADCERGEVPIDIFINNAGQLTGGLLENQPLEAIYQMYQVNLLGPTHLLNRLIPLMEKRPEALIVNNASVSGILHFPCGSTYAAAKAGMIALSRCLESELKRSNVRTLILLTPGVKTRMYDEIPKLYGAHLDLSALSSQPPEMYAQKVADAIERGKTELWPRGSLRVALFLARFSPGVFRWLSTLGFRRQLSAKL